jgi:aminopeptidase C
LVHVAEPSSCRLNKSNYYLESMIELADKPMDDRTVYHLNHDLISDGGQVSLSCGFECFF